MGPNVDHLWHGVTSVVMGNCGFGVAPTRPEHRDLILRTLENVEGMSLSALQMGLGAKWPFETFPQFLDTLEKRGTAINVAALVGHTPVRLYVMGEDATEREAGEDEIAKMRAIVKDALEAGAIGFATSKSPNHLGYSGKPVPSRVAALKEIRALASTLASGRGVMEATGGPDFFLPEFEAIARDYGCTITWAALLVGFRIDSMDHHAILAQSLEFYDSGLRIFPQVSPRPLTVEFQFKAPFLMEFIPAFKPLKGADRESKEKIYADPGFRAAFKAEPEGPKGGAFTLRWDQTVIASCSSEPALDERNLAEVARERDVHPIDLALDLALATDLEARFRMAVLNNAEDEVAEVLCARPTVLGISDAGAHASQLCDACLPTYLLGRWVRDKRTISLERAIWMLTARPAEVFGITDRGVLKPGFAADVTIFDPDKVNASALRRVHDFPAGQDRLVADACGIDAVIVNGVVLRRDNTDQVSTDGPLPGRLLRHGHA